MIFSTIRLTYIMGDIASQSYHPKLWISVSILSPINRLSVSILSPITDFSVSILSPMIATALVHQRLAGSLKTRKIYKNKKDLLKRASPVDNHRKSGHLKRKDSGCAATTGLRPKVA